MSADNPKLWRERAAEARVQAEQMSEVSPRGMMALIADLYERLAEQAEQRVTAEDNRTVIEEPRSSHDILRDL